MWLSGHEFVFALAAALVLFGSASAFLFGRVRSARRAALDTSVLRSLESHIAVLDRAGNITDVNEAWRRFGRANGATQNVVDANGINYLEVCRHAVGPQSDGACEIADGIEAVLGGRERLFTHEYPCHSRREQRWFLLHVTPLAGDEGGAVAAHVDISQRKLLEREVMRYQNELQQLVDERSRELKSSEEQLRDLYENAPVGYMTVAADGQVIQRWNRALAALLGYTDEQLAGMTLAELYAPGRAGVYRAVEVHARARDGQVVRDAELLMRRRDGTPVWVSMNLRPKTDADARTIETRCAVVDISARKTAEEHLRLTERIFAETAEAILITDADRRIVDMNSAFCEVSGYGRDELLGRTPAMLQSGRHDDEFYHAMWTVLQAKGHWRGELWDRRKNGEAFPSWTSISAVRNDAGEVTNYVGVFSDITSIKETERRLEHLAHFDQLTGLANRMLFHDRLRSALARADRHDESLAVLYIDLDGFKPVNDSLGHPAGDELLVRVADALRHCVREEDTLARLGGDEFAIILVELDRADPHAERVAQRVIESLRFSLPFGDRTLHISASVGVALYPSDGHDASSILRHADQAMYHAKERGRDGYEFFDPAINARVVDRIHLESDLRSAVDARQLFVEYQPIVDLVGGGAVCVEALVRWRHPRRGVVPPSEFVSFAEETGLIVPLGQFVFARACDDAADWRAGIGSILPFAVNLSPIQFRDNDLVAVIERIFAEADLPLDALHVEVTEGLVMENLDRSVDILTCLKRLGVSVSIDDFGTGYSSLSSLSRLPVDVLKIDRSFIQRIPQDRENCAIVTAVVSMAHALDMRVIAEGVERSEQLAFLVEAGCDEAQGFLLGRPLAADRLVGELRRIARASPLAVVRG